MEDGKKSKIHTLYKAIIVILVYFIYNWFFGSTLKSLFNIDYYANWPLMLISDLLFLIFCVYAYNDDIEDDTKTFKENIKENILTILKYIGLVYAFTIGISIISTIMEKALNVTFELSNNAAITKLNPIYMIFKTLVFTTIAETIVYHKTIKSVTQDNKLLYIIIACLFNGLMNIIYQPINDWTAIYILLVYMIRMTPICLLYNKKNNIIMLMFVSLICNAITLLITFIGGGA